MNDTETVKETRLRLTGKRRRATVSWEDGRGTHSLRLDGRVVLGSTEDAGVRVSEAAVSRLHAELELTDDGVWLRDLGSRNGTWLGAARIERVLLVDDVDFEVGGVTVAVRFERAPTSVPLWPEPKLGALLGASDVMRELFHQLNSVASSDAAVLIHGETGTGKELVASTLHALSKRREGPLVVVDCGAMPEALLEAELFGHTRGAFTGAHTAREGAIESARGGTVFLDEIGELPLALQPRLLRALESRTVRKLGQSAHAPVDVRFIAATHRDLEAMVARGEFREDLYFRLAVLLVRVPPLRAHLDDLSMLLDHFMRRHPPVHWSPQVLAELRAYRWPGNARELRTFSERVAALGLEQALSMLRGASVSPPQYAPAGGLPQPDLTVPYKELREQWMNHFEREYVRGLMAEAGSNITELAERAQVDRSYLHRLIRKHDL